MRETKQDINNPNNVKVLEKYLACIFLQNLSKGCKMFCAYWYAFENNGWTFIIYQ
jgi:hypothetical protein